MTLALMYGEHVFKWTREHERCLYQLTNSERVQRILRMNWSCSCQKLYFGLGKGVEDVGLGRIVMEGRFGQKLFYYIWPETILINVAEEFMAFEMN